MRKWQLLLSGVLLILAPSAVALAQAPESQPAPAQTQPSTEPAKNADDAAAAQPRAEWGEKLERWFELQTATITLRYRFQENAQGVTTNNHMQDQDIFRGRLKLDAGGRYSLNALVGSGNQFNGSWNNTGVGTGDAVTNFYLKQLFFAAEPLGGVEVQYGGIGILRGEATEITTYDNDGYIVGERLTLRRPRQFFFDEIDVTYAYLGDLNQPNLNKRYHRLKQSNYHQFMVGKKLGKRLAFSADYTFQSGVETLREAIKLSLPHARVVDGIRFENYQRMDVNPAYGFALTGEKKLSKRLTVSGGYAQIDPHYGGLNGDRYNFGKRVYAIGAFTLCPELIISTYATHTVGDPRVSSHRARFDLLLTYDLLKSLKRFGIV